MFEGTVYEFEPNDRRHLQFVPPATFTKRGVKHFRDAYRYDAAAPFIVDVSFGHAQATPANLKRIGAAGAIVYAGCSDPDKNATIAEVEALAAAGMLTGLVIENGARDLAGGAPVGAAQGQALRAAAVVHEYELACVLFLSADYDSRSAGDLAAISAALGAAKFELPGLYGNSYAIDHSFAAKTTRVGWQSDSTSFSNGTSVNAHLLQRFNDPRAQGLPFDVNDILRAPIGLMGEKMTAVDLTADAVAAVVNGVKAALSPQIGAIFNDVETIRGNTLKDLADFNLDTVESASIAGLVKAVAGLPAAVAAAVTAQPDTDVEKIVDQVLANTKLVPAAS